VISPCLSVLARTIAIIYQIGSRGNPFGLCRYDLDGSAKEVRVMDVIHSFKPRR
jgi:hypothetical protein